MTLRGEYKGRDAYGVLRYDLTVSLPDVPEGIAVLYGVCEQDLMSGKTLLSDFCEVKKEEYKVRMGPSIRRVRDSVTRQERRIAESLGGHRQSGSGARPGYRGDGRVEGKFRIENKMTRSASIRIPLADLRKIRSECGSGEVPLYEIEFRDKNTLEVKEAWILVPWKEWEKRANATDDDS